MDYTPGTGSALVPMHVPDPPGQNVTFKLIYVNPSIVDPAVQPNVAVIGYTNVPGVPQGQPIVTVVPAGGTPQRW